MWSKQFRISFNLLNYLIRQTQQQLHSAVTLFLSSVQIFFPGVFSLFADANDISKMNNLNKVMCVFQLPHSFINLIVMFISFTFNLIYIWFPKNFV